MFNMIFKTSPYIVVLR